MRQQIQSSFLWLSRRLEASKSSNYHSKILAPTLIQISNSLSSALLKVHRIRPKRTVRPLKTTSVLNQLTVFNSIANRTSSRLWRTKSRFWLFKLKWTLTCWMTHRRSIRGSLSTHWTSCWWHASRTHKSCSVSSWAWPSWIEHSLVSWCTFDCQCL